MLIEDNFAIEKYCLYEYKKGIFLREKFYDRLYGKKS